MARRNPADTPLMRQFLEVKQTHPDGIVFFRMGDFYEMFFEDAVIAAKALDLTLTSRDKGRDDAIPMCGIPHHAGRGYIARMTELGHTVVVCEQTEDPKQAKGLVKREVVRIITPGCVLDDEVLEPKSARYVAAVIAADAGTGPFGLAHLDVSTGEFRATEVADLDALVGELSRIAPREVLTTEHELARDASPGALSELPTRYRDTVYTPVKSLSEHDAEVALSGLEPPAAPLVRAAAARAAGYARATQPAGELPLTRLQVYGCDDAVVLDEAAIANLELCHTLIGGHKRGSLLSVLDRTETAPGGRLLRRWLLYPLTDIAAIRRRQDAVAYLVDQPGLRAELRGLLGKVYDLERLANRTPVGLATPRDLGRITRSLARLPDVAQLLSPGRGGDANSGSAELVPERLRLCPELVDELMVLHGELSEALVDDPPPVTKDGGIIRDGYCPIVDDNRGLASGGRTAIAEIETRERAATGIPSLKVKFNKVFGYYIEVTRTHLSRVPDHYTRKQTISTGERFVTVELADLEARILSAQEALQRQESELFSRLVARVAQKSDAIIRAGLTIATIDCSAALAEVAHLGRYTRPVVDDSDELEIVDGRHPVVETMVPAGTFVPNDCRLSGADRQILLITGPNMAGKSTYMRQVAHIALLAQIGSFVPAASARIGAVDRIFTRVGAADNLSRGESTFMVEMRETAAIVAGATRRSLVVLDEVGRGTSTFDGVSIAWAVTEYLHDAIGARTLFATHYHELCALAESRPRIANVSVAVRERAGEIAFLRQVVPGGASRSYGIDVARLAGLPGSVVARARQMLAELESGRKLGQGNQLSLFDAAPDAGGVEHPLAADDPTPAGAPELVARLGQLDPDRMTPLDALIALAELRKLL